MSLYSISVDGADFQLRERLAMALMLLVVLATTHLEDAHFVVLTLLNDLGRHGCARHQRSADLQFAASSHCQHFTEHHFLANVRSNLFYFNLVADGNAILLASGFYDRVHRNPL